MPEPTIDTTTHRITITMRDGKITQTPCYCDDCYLGPGVRSYWRDDPDDGGKQSQP